LRNKLLLNINFKLINLKLIFDYFFYVKKFFTFFEIILILKLM